MLTAGGDEIASEVELCHRILCNLDPVMDGGNAVATLKVPGYLPPLR